MKSAREIEEEAEREAEALSKAFRSGRPRKKRTSTCHQLRDKRPNQESAEMIQKSTERARGYASRLGPIRSKEMQELLSEGVSKKSHGHRDRGTSSSD